MFISCAEKTSKVTLSMFEGFENGSILLIQNGAEVNVVGQDGNTALTWAAFKG